MPEIASGSAETRAARWAKRDAQNAAAEEYYAKQEQAETDRLVKVVLDAFNLMPLSLLVADGYSYTKADMALIAVDALRESGVVFASIATDCEQYDGGGDVSISTLAYRWRIGSQIGRTLYIDTGGPKDPDDLFGLIDDAEIAAHIVALHNAWYDAEVRDPALRARRAVVFERVIGRP